ncbi:hypothetical protein OS493_000192 [Desmophyllum pertusum]|uniref:Uncharacterized protein n=1 Tax=Desmophyllum pertusum TaxID=174260 RepID=A0A9X0A6P1_9CNID|nr:hypothetical protein OS493_000192 [Desmophyllum pertusum]
MQREKLNNRGQYLSFRDPEWWIQSDNTRWRNPYARWGNEHGTSLYEERYIRPEFVVSVDTSSPKIRRVLEDGLNMAEDMMREKASFAIEFNFNPMILRWWKTQESDDTTRWNVFQMTATVGANFVITNCSAVNHFLRLSPRLVRLLALLPFVCCSIQDLA